MDNVGKTRNKGVEIALNSVNFQNNDFRWTTNVNFSLNRDKIIELRGDGKDDITNKWFIGEPLRVFYDYNVVGTWQENETYVENGHTISWDAESGKFLNEEGKEYQKGAVPGSLSQPMIRKSSVPNCPASCCQWVTASITKTSTSLSC